jgi:hypothetical protein
VVLRLELEGNRVPNSCGDLVGAIDQTCSSADDDLVICLAEGDGRKSHNRGNSEGEGTHGVRLENVKGEGLKMWRVASEGIRIKARLSWRAEGGGGRSGPAGRALK